MWKKQPCRPNALIPETFPPASAGAPRPAGGPVVGVVQSPHWRSHREAVCFSHTWSALLRKNNTNISKLSMTCIFSRTGRASFVVGPQLATCAFHGNCYRGACCCVLPRFRYANSPSHLKASTQNSTRGLQQKRTQGCTNHYFTLRASCVPFS